MPGGIAVVIILVVLALGVWIAVGRRSIQGVTDPKKTGPAPPRPVLPDTDDLPGPDGTREYRR